MAHIAFDNVDLDYPIRGMRITLKEYLVRGLFRHASLNHNVIHALKNVSFRIDDGERVGIIGLNGAGKSTLLRTIGGIYPVARGRREVEGSFCALFDIALGFEMDANGWQNIYYRSYLQGETPKSVKAKLNEIAEFSELGEFLDLPLRCYSHGMVMRLAFSIATSSHPEILLIDEVFGTGDLQFQQKAEARMTEFIEKAKIVIMVGHNLEFIKRFCQRVFWMHEGMLRADGPAEQIVEEYRKEAGEVRRVPKRMRNTPKTKPPRTAA
jgi:ABC-type polysaccharide/polyol phosphate transport system ATPase subunit